MKRIIIYSFIIGFMASACETIPLTENIPDKYNLDRQLERLDRAHYIHDRVIDIIDKQSFMMKELVGHYHYLIILKNSSNFLPMSPTVSIQATDHSVNGPWFRPGDRVVSYHDGGNEIHLIDRIYNIKNREEAKLIRAQLRGEMN